MFETQSIFVGMGIFAIEALPMPQQPPWPCVLLQKVEKKDGENFAKRLGFPFMEASAKSGDKVEEAFLKLVKEVKRRLIDKGPDSQVRPRACRL